MTVSVPEWLPYGVYPLVSAPEIVGGERLELVFAGAFGHSYHGKLVLGPECLSVRLKANGFTILIK